MSVKVIFIPNMLEDIKVEGFFSPGSLGNILNEFYLLRKADYPNLIKTKVRIEKKKPDSEDWELIPPTEWIDYKVEDNVELRIIPSYTGGGGSWGTIIGAILFVAGVAVGVFGGPAGWAWGGKMMVMGAMMVIGTALAYTGTPIFGAGPDLASTSPTYSWEDQPNQTDPGLPVPIIYGTHRITPHLINAYIDQSLGFIWNLASSSSTPTSISTGSGINVFRTETDQIRGIGFKITNPNLTYVYNTESPYSYGDPCNFKIEYAKVGDGYTVYGTVTVPAGVDRIGGGTGILDIQINDLPIGQYNIRLTNLGTSNLDQQYWSEVKEYRQATINQEVDTQYLYLLYGVCEGQIESISDIEINGTKLDSFSEKPEYWVRLGTNHKPADNCATATIPHDPTLCNKTPIPYFNDVRNYKAQGTSGGQKLSSNVAVVMTTDGTNVGSILYHLRIPSLYKVNPSSGDMEENSVDIRMQYRLQGAGVWSTAWDMTIKSNTRAPIDRYFRIPASSYLTAGQYEVRVEKLSQDSTDLKSINDIYFMGIYEIQDLNLSYPNTALLAIRMKATGQVSGGLPKVSCMVKGLKILQLTAGTIANSSNNVNCLYNLFTNQRYGLGNYLETANINIEQWKTEEVYCDATVGGVTRFKLDMVIDGLAGALDLIGRICTTFRALPIYSEGVINIVIEKDTDTPVQIFNMSNIIAGSLTVNYFDKTQTPNVVEAQFANEQRNYDMDFIQIRSSEAEIATVKEIKKKIALLGITRPDQIIRIGRWIYNSGIYIGQSISFKAMIDAVHCQPGDLLEFQHDVLQIGDGGRIVAATTNQVTLDKDVTITAIPNYVITGRIIINSPADQYVETKAVDKAATTGGNYPWTGKIIQMAEAFTTAPPVDSPYAFGAVGAESVTYRIVKISKDPEFNVAIDAIEYNASIYAETGFVVPHRSPTRAVDVLAPPPAVTNLTLAEATNEYGIVVSFTIPYPMDNFHSADIQLSVDGGLTYRSIVTVYDNSPYVIKDLIPGMEYFVRIVSYSQRGVMCKTPAVSSIWISGTNLRPGNVYGLQIKGEGTSQYWITKDCEFTWNWDNTYGRGGTFDYFRVKILKTDGTSIREEQVKEKYYNYFFEKNKKDNGAPIASFQIQVTAVNTAGMESLRADSLVVYNLPPNPIQGLITMSSLRNISLAWTLSTEVDILSYEIYRSDTDDSGTSTKIGEVSANASSYIDNGLTTGTTKYYWLKAKDVFGQLSSFSVGASGAAIALQGGDLDTTPPATPTGLGLTSAVEIDADGHQQSYIQASWTANIEGDLSHYEYRVKVSGGNYIYGYVTINSIKLGPVVANQTYYVGIRAMDSLNNKSGFCTDVSTTSAKDTSAPGTPANPAATAGIQYIVLTWDYGTETDLSYYQIFRDTVDSIPANPIASSKKNYFVDGNRTGGQIYYYWVKVVDTSGNVSSATASVNATPRNVQTNDVEVIAATKILIDGTVYLTNWRKTGDLTKIDGGEISTSSVLAQAITVASGLSLGNINTYADNPAARINALSTQITPGLVLVYGSTSLSDWRHGSDLTKIDGGDVYANSITANKISVGSRGLTIQGIEVSAQTPTANKLYWSAGVISYMLDDGSNADVSIDAGNVAWTSGTVYLYWVKAATVLATTTTRATAFGADNVLIASYRGGTDLVVTYGRTIIDGSDIVAATITADRLVVSTLSAIVADLGTITAGNITLDAVGFIRGGQTAYNTGVGFWLGYSTGYKLSIGNPAGNFLTWDGSVIAINGTIVITGGSGYANISDKPTALSGINSGEGTKLGGIESGADVTSAHTAAAISGQGALATLSAVAASNCDTTIISGGKIITGLLTADNIQTGTLLAARLSASIAYITNTAQIANAVIQTANIGLLQVTSATIAELTVGTDKITAQAVTRGAEYINNAAIAYTRTETEIGTLTITTNLTTDYVWLWARALTTTQPAISDGKGGDLPVGTTLRIRKDSTSGTIIDQWTISGYLDVSKYPITLMGIAQPGSAGSIVYKLTAQAAYGTLTINGAISYRLMMALAKSK